MRSSSRQSAGAAACQLLAVALLCLAAAATAVRPAVAAHDAGGCVCGCPHCGGDVVREGTGGRAVEAEQRPACCEGAAGGAAEASLLSRALDGHTLSLMAEHYAKHPGAAATAAALSGGGNCGSGSGAPLPAGPPPGSDMLASFGTPSQELRSALSAAQLEHVSCLTLRDGSLSACADRRMRPSALVLVWSWHWDCQGASHAHVRCLDAARRPR